MVGDNPPERLSIQKVTKPLLATERQHGVDNRLIALLPVHKGTGSAPRICKSKSP